MFISIKQYIKYINCICKHHLINILAARNTNLFYHIHIFSYPGGILTPYNGFYIVSNQPVLGQ